MIETFNTTTEPPNGRGCGKRKKRKIYMVSGHAPIGEGVPLHYNLIDPVMFWANYSELGCEQLPVHRGGVLHQRSSGIYDVIISVGQVHNGTDAYRAPWDFYEEVARYGASRAMSPLLEYEKLTPRHYDAATDSFVGSRMIFLHAKASATTYYKLRGAAPVTEDCHVLKSGQHDDWEWENTDNGWHPRGHAWTPYQPEPTPCAFGLKSLAYVSHTQADSERLEGDGNLFRVNMPSFSYEGIVPTYPREPLDIEQMHLAPGLFLGLPITGFEFAHQADAEQKARLEDIGFQVDVLDY